MLQFQTFDWLSSHGVYEPRYHALEREANISFAGHPCNIGLVIFNK